MKTNCLLLGDSRKILKGLPSSSINLVVTSPPYYLYKSYETQYSSFDQYLVYLKEILTEVVKVLKDCGFLCINIDDRHLSFKRSKRKETENLATHAYLIKFLLSKGLVYRDPIFWKKVRGNKTSGGSHCFLGSYPYPPHIPILVPCEYILIFKKPGRRKVNKEIKEKSKLTIQEFKTFGYGLWNFPGEYSKKHPAVFPLELPKRLIKMYSFYGDIVLDPFMGRGTTCKAARMLGRQYIGIDIKTEYVSLAKKYLSQLELNIKGGL